jgi:ABC-type enterochelin transport system ATPase subunit
MGGFNMKVSYELKQGYIDIWNEESEEWDRYIKVNKKSVVEEEKKIPEKLENKIDTTFENYNYSERMRLTEMINKINEIIDYLDYLKSKGE